jgi:hypothetical protein
MMNGKESQQQQPVGKFSLFTAGLHNKILIDSEQQQNISPPKQLSARSKLPTNPLPPQQQQNPHTIIGANVNKQQKPKRPSSANPRVRSAHQHQQQREPGKIQKNHPILNNPHHHPPPQGAAKRAEPEYEGRNFAILNKFVLIPSRLSSSFDSCSSHFFFFHREELLETLTEIKKQQKNNDILIAQLRADNQRFPSSLFLTVTAVFTIHSLDIDWKERSPSNSIESISCCLLISQRTVTFCSRSEKK